MFRFVKSLDQGSKRFFKTYGFPSLIGFGSYHNSCTNAYSTIHDGNKIVEYIEINNNWTPEYYITFNEDRQAVFDEVVDIIKQFKSLGHPPEEITVKIINYLASRDSDCVFRKCHVLVGLEIAWKERTIAVDDFPGRLKNTFRNMIESPSSIVIAERPFAGYVC
jgi:hypothetical protein